MFIVGDNSRKCQHVEKPQGVATREQWAEYLRSLPAAGAVDPLEWEAQRVRGGLPPTDVSFGLEAPAGGRQDDAHGGRRQGGLSTAHILTEPPTGPARYQRCRPRITELPSVCCVSYAVRANLVRLEVPSVESKQVGLPPQRPWKRGEVQGFSRDSRLRLLQKLNSVNRDAVPAGRVWFCTLTYHHAWGYDAKVWKKQLHAYLEAHTRAWGDVPVVWKLEFQQRGAPHFHLLVLWAAGAMPKLAEYRRWQAETWNRIAEKGNDAHLAAGTQADPSGSWNQVNAYVGKYMAKSTVPPVDPETGEVTLCGRWWGIRHEASLPISFEREALSEQQAIALRRVLLKVSGQRRRGKLQAVTAFCLAETVKRAVDWVRKEKVRSDVWLLRNQGSGPGDGGEDEHDAERRAFYGFPDPRPRSRQGCGDGLLASGLPG